MDMRLPTVGCARAKAWRALVLGSGFMLGGFGLGVPTASAQAPPAADIALKLKVLERFRGTWDVTVRTHQPQAAVVTYTETYDWVLGGHFLRGDSGRKSDGSQDIVFATYDAATDGYPFWIFTSSGAWFYLAPGSWDAASRSFVWKNPPQLSTSYLSRCEFPDERTRRCHSLVKDWKGTVLLDQEASAVRRRAP